MAPKTDGEAPQIDGGAPQTDGEAPQIDGEVRLVRGAILMVAAQGAPRVVVAGLRFGELAFERSKRFAGESGVRVRLLQSSVTGRMDVAVETIVP